VTTTPNTIPTPDSNLIGDILDAVKTAENDPWRSANTTIPTGLADLDALTGGLSPGQLTVIASRPGIGRTTLLTNMCRHAAVEQSIPAVAYTTEETRQYFATRILSAEASVPLHHMHTGTTTSEEWARLSSETEKVTAAPLRILAPARLSVQQLEDEIADLVLNHGVRLVAVDGIHRIHTGPGIGAVAARLAELARELDVPVVATDQVGRGPVLRACKRPILDDLDDATASAADVVVLLYREDAYVEESPRAGEVDLIVAKRRNGPCGTVQVAVQGAFGRLVDVQVMV